MVDDELCHCGTEQIPSSDLLALVFRRASAGVILALFLGLFPSTSLGVNTDKRQKLLHNGFQQAPSSKDCKVTENVDNVVVSDVNEIRCKTTIRHTQKQSKHLAHVINTKQRTQAPHAWHSFPSHFLLRGAYCLDHKSGTRAPGR